MPSRSDTYCVPEEVGSVVCSAIEDAHSEHSTFSSGAHRENWISSSWIRQSSNKRTPFERCTPWYPSG